MNIYRHGDLLLVPIDHIAGRKQRRQHGRIVLLEGEVTGHAHAVVDNGADLYVDESGPISEETTKRFLSVLADGGVHLIHEEHATLTIPPGNYEIRRQREYEPERIRFVTD